MPANEEAVKLVTTFEGFYSNPYLCPAGVPTIGYGTIRYPSGVRVTLNDGPITKEQAVGYLEYEQLRLDIKIRAKFGSIGINRLGALGSFAYNLGFTALSCSTLAKKALSGDHTGAEEQFGRWVYGGGRRLLGLVRRREAERVVYTRDKK